MAKLAIYKQSKQVTKYLDFKKKNPDVVFVENEVGMECSFKTVEWIFWHYNEGHIRSLSPYLQRILLVYVWQIKSNLKAKSYIRGVWKDKGRLTPFCLIPTKLVLENVKESLKHIKQMEISKQIKKVEKELERYMKNGVMYINIDGQSRSRCAIIPYIKGEFNLKDDSFKEPIPVANEKTNSNSDVSLHKFDKITEGQQTIFLARAVAVNIFTKGTLEEISDALIDINSNEKWTAWQIIFNSMHPNMLVARINGLMDISWVQNFLHNKMEQKTYKVDYSGWEHFIGECLVWLSDLKTPDLDRLEEIKKNQKNAPTKQSVKFIKEMLDIWSVHYTNKIKVKPITLSTFIDFRDVLKNYNNKTDGFYQAFSIPKINVLSEKNFMDWFLAKVKSFEARYKLVNGKKVINDEHWIQDPKTKKFSYFPEGYPAHGSGGVKLVSKKGRIDWLLEVLNNDMPELIKNKVISSNTSMPSWADMYAIGEGKDSDGDDISLTEETDPHELGHKQSVANEGDNDTDNIQLQKKKSNRQYGKRNMIKMESIND
jgi:hypothetical protein